MDRYSTNIIKYLNWVEKLGRDRLDTISYRALRGCFHFSYPFTLNVMFPMMVFYRFSIECIKKTKEFVILFVIHDIKMYNSKFINRRLLQFFYEFLPQNPFKEWTSRNLGIYLGSYSFILILAFEIYRIPCL